MDGGAGGPAESHDMGYRRNFCSGQESAGEWRPMIRCSATCRLPGIGVSGDFVGPNFGATHRAYFDGSGGQTSFKIPLAVAPQGQPA
jgi:hypothetical protein